VSPVCPIDELSRGLRFSRALFPGCPPQQFYGLGVTCPDGTDASCPHPCRATVIERPKLEPEHLTLTYLDRGECTARGRDVACRENADVVTVGTLDAAGNLASLHTPPERTLAYSEIDMTFRYDENHRLVSTTERRPGGFRVQTYTYDPAGRVVRDVGTGRGFPLDERYTYDEAGRIVQLTRTEGHPSVSDVHTTWFTYDTRGRPTRIEHEASTIGAVPPLAPIRWSESYEYCDAP